MSETNFMPIYKINHLIGDNITDAIYVFYGKNPAIKNVNDLFVNDQSNHAFVNIFNSDELSNISKNKIRVRFQNNKYIWMILLESLKLKFLTNYAKIIHLKKFICFV